MYSSKFLAFLQPYLILIRWGSPWGTLLLMFPCLWALALARPSNQVYWAGFLALGSFLMRASGCIINDLMDADVDAQVPRTRGRALPSKLLGRGRAVVCLGIFLALAASLLVFLPTRCRAVAVLLALGVVIYPRLKRYTFFPQFFLGFLFNGGVILTWLIFNPGLSLPVVLLYLACACWTVAYDTLYALQDKEADQSAGVKSFAIFLRDHVHLGIFFFYSLFYLILCALAWYTAKAPLGVMAALCWGATFHVYKKYSKSEPSLQRLCERNVWIGVLIWGSFLASNLVECKI